MSMLCARGVSLGQSFLFRWLLGLSLGHCEQDLHLCFFWLLLQAPKLFESVSERVLMISDVNSRPCCQMSESEGGPSVLAEAFSRQGGHALEILFQLIFV